MTRVKVRLKGDLPDHWKGDRWSLRVKTRDDAFIYGMPKFSLQDPVTRNGAWEWVFHILLAKLDLIHLNYDFVHVKQNKQYMGVYAVEEHFTPELLEHNNLPLSAILCYDESYYWASYEKIPNDRPAMYKVYSEHYNWAYPKFYVHMPQAVKYDFIEYEQPLTSALEAVQDDAFDLLFNFREKKASAGQTFDVDQLAMYFALCDYLGAWHGLLWGNMRFYFNEKANRLIPVGFDAEAGYEIEQLVEKNDKLMQLNGAFHHHLFEDTAFVAAYQEALVTLDDQSFWEDFFEKHETELNKIVALIAQNDLDYTFSPALIDLNRAKIQEALGADR